MFQSIHFPNFCINYHYHLNCSKDSRESLAQRSLKDAAQYSEAIKIECEEFIKNRKGYIPGRRPHHSQSFTVIPQPCGPYVRHVTLRFDCLVRKNPKDWFILSCSCLCVLPGKRSAEGIVQWLKRRTGPGTQVLDSVKAAAQFIDSNNITIVGFFDVCISIFSIHLTKSHT